MNGYKNIPLRFFEKRQWGLCVLSSWVLMSIAVIMLIVSGYYLMYHLFFLELPVESIAFEREGGQEEKFKYDGVAYFDGIRIADGEKIRLGYHSIRILDRNDHKRVEIFVRTDQAESNKSDEKIGQLRVEQTLRRSDLKVYTIDLSSDKLQRYVIPLYTAHRSINNMMISFVSADPGKVDHVVLATNIRGAGFLPHMITFACLGVFVLVTNTVLGRSRHVGRLIVVVLSLAVMFWFHSGAFVSNEYVHHGSSAYQNMAKRCDALARGGKLGNRVYWGPGFALVPLLTFAIEGAGKDGVTDFVNTYPTSRYIMFVWTALGLVVLIRVLYERVDPFVSLLTGLLAASFYPFIVDMYFIMDDSYLIPLMLLFVAAYIEHVYDDHSVWKGAVIMGLIIFLMMLTKVTAAFLAIIAPFSIWCKSFAEKRVLYDRKACVLGLVLVLSVVMGRKSADLIIPDSGKEIMEDVNYADNVLWEIMWAANGLYDHHSAHWFTKSGGLRSKRVAEATGLPCNVSHARHSAIATEMVYRPGFLRMLRERPGFFYSNIFIRSYNHAFCFYRYTYGGYNVWKPWLNDGFRADEIISGEQVYGLATERENIRYGRMWKISPLVLLTKFAQADITRMADWALVLFALLGMFSLRRMDVIVFFVMSFVAKMVFASGIHGLTRYVNFINVVMIIGLAAFVRVFLMRLSSSDLFSYERSQS